jgi:hypothetical protein
MHEGLHRRKPRLSRPGLSLKIRRPAPSTWFSILQGKSLSGASFNSVAQLREHIDAFIEAYNENAKRFVQTKTEVHQCRVKDRRISQL